MLESARGYMFVFPPDALGALGPGTGCTNTTRRVAVTGNIPWTKHTNLGIGRPENCFRLVVGGGEAVGAKCFLLHRKFCIFSLWSREVLSQCAATERT